MRTLQLAGDSLEGLLEQVRREHGDQARIVEANKCRTGGLAGFFARETFEVVVELDDEPVTGPEPDLDAGSGATTAVAMPHVTSVLELADAVNELERSAAANTSVPAEAPVSTETTAFASLLERLARDVDPSATAGRTDALVVSQPELFEAAAPPRVIRPAAPSAPVAAPRPPAAAPAPTPATRAAVVPALARLGLPESLCAPGGERDIRLVLADRLRTLPAAPPIPTSTGAVLAVAGDADRALGLAQDLARELGLDTGDVLLATPEDGTHRVPAWLHLDNRDTAADRRRSWWRRDRLTLVAVDAGFGMPNVWARRMLDAIEPTLTWGVVEATWKPEDVERWSDGLGGVDSLAVQNLRTTVSPAAILNADVPVARLDGAVATPTVWSTLLAERLAA